MTPVALVGTRRKQPAEYVDIAVICIPGDDDFAGSRENARQGGNVNLMCDQNQRVAGGSYRFVRLDKGGQGGGLGRFAFPVGKE